MPHTGKPHLGELERAVMDVLWAADEDTTMTVREVHAALVPDRDVAYTTVMTVLDRLARKALVTQERAGRAFRYRPRASRAELTAELMHEALSDFTRDDRGQALVAFVGDASAADLDALRRALADLDR
ncbi:BlaI/MecI/CopY family transcriptional regulator [Nocardioides sp.]|uniref:BlaI/MecI/CopY family transcriptional regulator n=1 Tax=Nocardioides sp. TaxID=35761 RepID=UPI003527B637